MPRPRPSPASSAEAEAIARLQHPHIVQIYHIGEADGLPFFELEYCHGGSLDQRLDGTPWPPRSGRRRLVETPGRGRSPRRTAWGSSTATSSRPTSWWPPTARPRSPTSAWPRPSDSDSDLTPERRDHGLAQLHGARAGRGLHQAGRTRRRHLRAGGDPLRTADRPAAVPGATLLETLEQVRATEPVPPSRLVPRLPRDVETICLKCLEKDPGRRYDGRPGVGRGPEAFQGRRADHGPADRPGRAGLAVVPSQSPGGGTGRRYRRGDAVGHDPGELLRLPSHTWRATGFPEGDRSTNERGEG